MKASVRMVCGGCLRSVDMSAAATGTPSNRCPHCDGPIESQLSQVNAGERGSRDPAHVDPLAGDRNWRCDRLGPDVGARFDGVTWSISTT